MQVWSFIKSESNTIIEEQWIAILFRFLKKAMFFYKLNKFLFHWHCIYDYINRHSHIIQMKMQSAFSGKTPKQNKDLLILSYLIYFCWLLKFFHLIFFSIGNCKMLLITVCGILPQGNEFCLWYAPNTHKYRAQ